MSALDTPWLKRHHDDEYIDEVRISVVPRYKTSGMSGDEWRISARLEFFRKGHRVWWSSFSKMETACAALGWFWRVANEGPDGPKGRPEPLQDPNVWHHVAQGVDHAYCFQAGCQEQATVEYRLKVEFSHSEGYPNPNPPTRPVHLRFCGKHATRGDCGLEDSDRNYEAVTP